MKTLRTVHATTCRTFSISIDVDIDAFLRQKSFISLFKGSNFFQYITDPGVELCGTLSLTLQPLPRGYKDEAREIQGPALYKLVDA